MMIHGMRESFLQSTEWERFQLTLGRKTWRAHNVLVIKHNLGLGLNYLYCPRPSTFAGNAISEIAAIAKSERSIFLKIDPSDGFSVGRLKFFPARPLQPQKTVILDLTRGEEELLAAMHSKTRYNLRLAEKKGVEVRIHESDEASRKLFWELLCETAKRDGFRTHARAYYDKMLGVRSVGFSNELFFAEYKGKVLAAALVNFYTSSSCAAYLHGASSRDHKEVMAPYLLHWRIIQEAKRRRFNFYDFWGINEQKWPGITRFKLGFGGADISYPPSIEIPHRPVLYNLYRTCKRLLQK